MTTLKERFQNLIAKYTSGEGLPEKLWQEIEKSYSRPKRYYHNLAHLENMFSELEQVQAGIKDWDTLLFALVYHDIVYQPTGSANEEKSADIAASRLSRLVFPKDQIEKCRSIILATKSHEESADCDVNYFTDADLCILGQDWEIYLEYARNVRKEYSVYPDFIYKPGRKKILARFLSMDPIYKTRFFSGKFERKAKENLRLEMNAL